MTSKQTKTKLSWIRKKVCRKKSKNNLIPVLIFFLLAMIHTLLCFSNTDFFSCSLWTVYLFSTQCGKKLCWFYYRLPHRKSLKQHSSSNTNGNSQIFDNDLVMHHVYIRQVWCVCLTMHIQGCVFAGLHYDSYENKEAACNAADSPRTHNTAMRQKRLENIWNLGLIVLWGRTLCPLSHGVTQYCVMKLKLLPRNWVNLQWTSPTAATACSQRLSHPLEPLCLVAADRLISCAVFTQTENDSKTVSIII